MTDLHQQIAALTPAQRALLEQRLKQQGMQPSTAPILPRAQSPVGEELPLSFAQQRLWFVQQLDPNSIAYNVPSALRLRGPLDVAALHHTLNALIQRHETLRTTFHLNAQQQPVQVIAAPQPLDVPIVDLAHLADPDATVEQLALAAAQRPFDLRQPLLRALLLRLHPTEHVLLLTTHHIISDRWSVGVFLRELSQLYEYFHRASPDPTSPAVPLPALPIQYADWAIWQRQTLQGERLDTQIRYWQQQLHNLTELDLPSDRPRPALPSYRGATHPIQLSAALSAALRKVSAQAGTTLFMLLLAAFQTLLHRYTQQTDIAIGTDVANRERPETRGLIGLLVNTLVLRGDLSGDPTFRDLLQRTRQVMAAALSHQDLPFEKLVEILNPERHLSQMMPLFQVKLDLQLAEVKPLILTGLEVERLPCDSGTVKYDLRLNLQDSEQGISGQVEYSTDLFDADRIARLAEHFRILLEGIAGNPGQRLSQLALLSSREQQQLQQWNQTQQDYPSRLIHELFEAQVEHTPDAIALTCQEQHLSYRCLDIRANQLAHHLLHLGAAREARIGICLPRTPELVVALLGVLKAGAAYVPLDPSYPRERLRWIAQDAEVSLLLTHADTPPLQLPHAHILRLDLAAPTLAQQPTTPPTPPAAATPANLAYLIYTSGSTGTPKGVAIEHRSTVAFLHWVVSTFSPHQLAAVLAATSVCFDLSVFELFGPLSCGGRVVLAESILELPDLAERHHLSLLNTVPSAMAPLLQGEGIPASISTLNLAGEALSASLVEQIYTHSAVEQLYNLYGPSETTTYSTTALIARPSGLSPRCSPPIGRPLGNTHAYILDAQLQLVPIGIAGELYLSGAGVARGYFRRPELTGERFLPHPFVRSLRLYKTGDRARYRSDGSIEYLGRLDQQVKLRGFRIELGEIEAVLSQHPDVHQAIVTLSSSASPQLIAHVIPVQAGSPPASTLLPHLHTHLQTRLPVHMLPARILLHDAFPLTPNGKIDRAGLAAMVPELPPTQNDEPPQTPAEETLHRIWQQLLGREAIGRHDNFFALGGDSILVMQLIAKASQEGLHFAPKQVFQHQTIAALAAAAATTGTISAPQEILTGPVPLIPIQRWFFEQNFAELHHWNQSMLLEIQQPLRPDRLEQVIQQLLNHHDSLRLRFQWTATGWQQTYGAAVTTAPLHWIDLAHLSDVQQTQVIASTAAVLQSSLDLSTLPLRVVFFDRGQNSGRLLLILHHLLVDGLSWRILLSDLHHLYDQVSHSQSPQLPPKTSAFRQWAEALLAYQPSPQELAYWQDRPTVPLPVDCPGNHDQNRVTDLDTVSVSLSPADTQALLQQAPAAYQTQINDLLLTALAQTVSTWTGDSTSLIELESHGREDLFDNIDLSRTIGWFTTLFPVWFDLNSARTPAAAIKTIKEQLRAIPHNGISYGIFRYVRMTEAQVSRVQPQIRFNYLGQIDPLASETPLFRLAPEAIGPLRSPQGHRDVLLDINALIRDRQLRLDWSYSRAIHHRQTIETLAEQYLIALRQLIQHCLSPDAGGYTPSDFPLLEIDQTELDELLTEL